MKEEDVNLYKYIKNKKFIFCSIVIVSLFLFYEVRKDEEILEKLKDNNIITKNNKDQKEDDIHLKNSKLLNMKIDKEKIMQLILTEKEKNNLKINNIYEEDKKELWKIQIFFVTLFCAIYGGLYLYSYQKETINKNIKEEKNYIIDDYTKYLLDEAELEFLINKEENLN